MLISRIRQEGANCKICFFPAIANSFGVSISENAITQSSVDTRCTVDYLGVSLVFDKL